MHLPLTSPVTGVFAVAASTSMLFLLLLFPSAPASDAQSFQEGLRFFPEVPTEKSTVTAIVSLTAPTPCHRVELLGFDVSEKDLAINVQVSPPQEGTACALVLRGHTLTKEVGIFAAGAYDARLYVNGVEKAFARLYVSANDIAVLSTGRYVDGEGGVHLVGEVQNTGGSPASLVRIDLAFFEQDRVLREEYLYSTMAVIMPNGTSGFSFILDDELGDKEYSARVTSYNKVAEQQAPEKGLLLVLDEQRLDNEGEGQGFGIVSGNVTNMSAQGLGAMQVKVACAIYDDGDSRQGLVVDSVFGYTDPANIAPGESAPFALHTHHPVGREFHPSCSAESQELALQEVRVIPEFHFATTAMAVAAASSLAAALVLLGRSADNGGIFRSNNI